MSRHHGSPKAKIGPRRGAYVATTAYFDEAERKWLEQRAQQTAFEGKRLSLSDIMRKMVREKMSEKPILSLASNQAGVVTAPNGENAGT